MTLPEQTQPRLKFISCTSRLHTGNTTVADTRRPLICESAEQLAGTWRRPQLTGRCSTHFFFNRRSDSITLSTQTYSVNTTINRAVLHGKEGSSCPRDVRAPRGTKEESHRPERTETTAGKGERAGPAGPAPSQLLSDS